MNIHVADVDIGRDRTSTTYSSKHQFVSGDSQSMVGVCVSQDFCKTKGRRLNVF